MFRHYLRLRALLVLAVGGTLALAGQAGAAPGAVDAVEVARSKAAIAYPRVHVSPTGEQGVVWLDTDPTDYAFRSRWRQGGGEFGPVNEITNQPSIEEPGFAFDSEGRAFVYYGYGNAPGAQYAVRPPGGPIGSMRTLTPCRRWVRAAVAPDGRLAVACSLVGMNNPPDNAVLMRADGIGKSFSAPAAPFASVDDNFIRPHLAWGEDGQLAMVLDMHDPSASKDYLRAYVLNSVGIATPFEVDDAPYSGNLYGLSVGGVTIAGDGAVVIASDSDAFGAMLYIRPVGAPAFAATALPWQRAAWPQTDSAGTVHTVLARNGPPLDYEYGVTTRPVGGSFGPVKEIVPPRPDTGMIDFKVAKDGTEFALFSAEGGPATVKVRSAGAADFGAPIVIAPEDSYIQGSALSGDGDLLVAWTRDLSGNDKRLFLGGVDSGKPPTLSLENAPKKAITGEPARFTALARDAMGIRSIEWRFGDGASAQGAAVSHSYTRAGRYEVEVKATDRAGNSTTLRHQVEVVGDGDKPARLRVAGPKRIKFKALRRKGVRFRVRTNEPIRLVGQLIARPRSARISVAGDLILAERALPIRSGQRVVKLKPAARLLGKRARKLRLKVRFAATDKAGNPTLVTRALQVRP